MLIIVGVILYDSAKDGAEAAWYTVLGLQESYAANTDDPAVDSAWAASSAAATDFRTAALNFGVHMEDGQWLVELFEDSCGPLLTGSSTGSGTGAHSGTATGSSTDVNQGWNVQTTEEDRVDTGLLAAGAAVTGAVVFRLRRTRA